MKILAINGSPRKGNTDFILNATLENSKEKVEIINLRDKKINFCRGGDNCCPVNLKCHIKDDMPEIYAKLEQADIIILASPAYFSNVTARMKNFMDRCNPYWFNKKLKGKKAFLIGVGGNEKSVKEMLGIMRTFLRILEIKEMGSYHTVADKIGEARNPKVIKELQDIASKLK